MLGATTLCHCYSHLPLQPSTLQPSLLQLLLPLQPSKLQSSVLQLWLLLQPSALQPSVLQLQPSYSHHCCSYSPVTAIIHFHHSPQPAPTTAPHPCPFLPPPPPHACPAAGLVRVLSLPLLLFLRPVPPALPLLRAALRGRPVCRRACVALRVVPLPGTRAVLCGQAPTGRGRRRGRGR